MTSERLELSGELLCRGFRNRRGALGWACCVMQILKMLPHWLQTRAAATHASVPTHRARMLAKESTL